MQRVNQTTAHRLPATLRERRRVAMKPVREWFDLTQGEFARALGVSRATIARWEAQHTGPEPNSAEGRLLAALLEVKELATKSYGAQRGRQWFRHVIPALQGRPIDVLIARGPVPIRDVLWEGWEGTY